MPRRFRSRSVKLSLAVIMGFFVLPGVIVAVSDSGNNSSQLGTTCVTPQGVSCPLATGFPLGSSCECPTSFGDEAGIVQ